MSSQPGLITSIYQEFEGARRAILRKAPSSVRDHAWVSPDATTCTIRAAPPRTSAVLTKLATKSGWLLVQQSNQNRTWKKKWCCVVPHTFLYMFDDPLDSSTSSINLENKTFNEILSCGAAQYDVEYDEEGRDVVNPSRSNLKAATVIDLECYKSVNKMQTGYVIELNAEHMKTDEIHNDNHDDDPLDRELRPLYFRVQAPEECKEWSDSFTSDRFSCVKSDYDELNQQVSQMNGQMKDYVAMMEEEEHKRKKAEMDAFQVRNAAQQMSSQVIKLVQEALTQKLCPQNMGENSLPTLHDKSSTASNNFTSMLSIFSVASNNPDANIEFDFNKKMEEKRVKSLDMIEQMMTSPDSSTSESISRSVEALVEFASFLVNDRMEMNEELIKTKESLRKVEAESVEKARFDTLKKNFDKMVLADRKCMADRVSQLESELAQSRHLADGAQRSLEVKTVEFEMLHGAYKKRIKELEEHKTLLKQEVLELRRTQQHVSSNIDRKINMDDKNFGLPELSKIKLTPEPLLVDRPKTPTNHGCISIPLTLGRDSSQSINKSNKKEKRDVAALDSVSCGDSAYRDISVNSSLGSLDISESKDKLFQQLKNIKDNTGKKWYSNSGCGEMTQFSSSMKSAGRQTQVSVFDSSTWLCGQNHDDVS